MTQPGDRDELETGGRGGGGGRDTICDTRCGQTRVILPRARPADRDATALFSRATGYRALSEIEGGAAGGQVTHHRASGFLLQR